MSIIPNGTIEVRQKTVGGIDTTTGYAAKPSEATWGDPIPCQYLPQQYNALATTGNGEHVTEQEYEILLDEQPFSGKQVRLTDTATGEVLGAFSVKQIEPLWAVCQIRLVV